MCVTGWADGYHEDGCSPERANEGPADRHHVAFSDLVHAQDQEAGIFQFAERFDGEEICFYVHTVWWWSVLLKSVTATFEARLVKKRVFVFWLQVAHN